MVQTIENLSRLHGEIISRTPHPTLPAYDLLTVRIDGAEPVPDKANLVSSLVGQAVGVAIRRELLASASPGARLHCRGKRTLDGVMCESDPAPGDFRIEST